MPDCILRRYLREYQGFDKESFNRIKDDVFVEGRYELQDENGTRMYSLQCGTMYTNIREIDSDWTFIRTRTKFSNSDDMMPIQIDDVEVGWIVPVRSLLDREAAIRDVTNQDSGKEALDICTIGLVKHNDCYETTEYTGDSNSDHFTLFDFYPDDTAIAFFLKSKIPQSYVSSSGLSQDAIDCIKTMLVPNGYIPHFVLGVEATRFGRFHHEMGRVNLPLVSEDLRNDASALSILLAHAANDPTAVGTFFGLYQILEHLMAKAYSVALKVVLSIAVLQKSPTHRMRSTLAHISFREPQLRFVFEGFSDQTHSQDVLLLAISSFLDVLDPTKESPDHCCQAVYRLRNKVVHSQSHWRISPQIEKDMSDVNEAFYKVVEELLISFSVASGEDYLRTRMSSKL